MVDNYPVGMRLDVSYPAFTARLSLLSDTRMAFEIKGGPFARAETVDITVVPLGNGLFAVSWQEEDGSTVTNVQDFDRGVIHSHATLPDRRFLRMTGTFAVVEPATRPGDSRPERNKAIVREAMTSLFQRHDASAVDRLYAVDYIQHNPGIAQGRGAVKELVAALRSDVHYEPGLVVAEDAYVAIHGRIRGWSKQPQVVVDLFRVENGQLAEHWDVLQDEAAVRTALSGVAMFEPSEADVQTTR